MYDDKLKNVISHAKEYGFVFQSSEIYDGLSAVYDYGQLGALLKNNIKEYWWKAMVQNHENIVGIDSAIFKESDVIFDKESRILISSFQKVGTGFSHDKLDMLILGVDTEEYFLQYLGRVFRRKDSSPIILDIVDEHPVLWKHFRTRSKVYRESGGQISVKK